MLHGKRHVFGAVYTKNDTNLKYAVSGLLLTY
jgi:hypothetical protein